MRKEKYIQIRKHKKTTYLTVRFYYRGSNGDRVLYSKTFNSADFATPGEAMLAACQHRDEMLARLHTVGLPETQAMTLIELMDRKEEVFARSKETNRKHRINFHKYIEPCYGTRTIDTITAADISRSLTAMADSCSRDLIKQVLSLWRLICKTAIRSGMIQMDPTATVEPPKSYKVIDHRAVLTDADTVRAMIAALGQHAKNTNRSMYNYKLYQFAIRVMYHTGLRPSECYALARSDIDLDNSTVRVRSRVGSTTEATYVVVPTKTEASARTVPLTDAARSVFAELLDFVPEDQPLLFVNYDGQLLNSDIVSNVVNRVAKTEGIDFRMYMLRHMFDNDLLTQGADQRSVMELMGHTEIKTTIGYARSTMERKAAIVQNREVVNKTVNKKVYQSEKRRCYAIKCVSVKI
jgi:site-specific recombinase XerD